MVPKKRFLLERDSGLRSWLFYYDCFDCAEDDSQVLTVRDSDFEEFAELVASVAAKPNMQSYFARRRELRDKREADAGL